MKKNLFSFYEVGGKVRDEFLGVVSKDIDYVVVPDFDRIAQDVSIHEIFNLLVQDIKLRGYEIYLITPRLFTIRAKMAASAIVADFVLARKEVGYKEGTREPIVVAGTLHDDLARRDFTMNAIAKDVRTGAYIDPFGGIEDIKKKILRTPIDGGITFSDDPLRLLRAIRFAITKGFGIDSIIGGYIKNFDYINKFKVVSEERIREELYKCFKHDTLTTLIYLGIYSELREYIFKHTNLWLKPTNEK